MTTAMTIEFESVFNNYSCALKLLSLSRGNTKSTTGVHNNTIIKTF